MPWVDYYIYISESLFFRLRLPVLVKMMHFTKTQVPGDYFFFSFFLCFIVFIDYYLPSRFNWKVCSFLNLQNFKQRHSVQLSHLSLQAGLGLNKYPKNCYAQCNVIISRCGKRGCSKLWRDPVVRVVRMFCHVRPWIQIQTANNTAASVGRRLEMSDQAWTQTEVPFPQVLWVEREQLCWSRILGAPLYCTTSIVL